MGLLFGFWSLGGRNILADVLLNSRGIEFLENLYVTLGSCPTSLGSYIVCVKGERRRVVRGTFVGDIVSQRHVLNILLSTSSSHRDELSPVSSVTENSVRRQVSGVATLNRTVLIFHPS